MFCAQNAAGKWVNLLQEQTEVEKSDQYTCPGCGQPVYLKRGQLKRPHFAHYKEGCDSFAEGETLEHLTLKASFFQWAQKAGYQPQLEAYLPEIAQRPDILLNDRTALEIQCSPLKLARLIERTQHYLEAGYQVIWIGGERFGRQRHLTQLQRAFCQYTPKRGVYFWQADWRKGQLHLFYHLKQTLQRTLARQQTFMLQRSNLRTVFAYQPEVVETADRLTEVIDFYRGLQRGLQQQKTYARNLQMAFYQQRQHVLYLPLVYYVQPRYEIFWRELDLYQRYRWWQFQDAAFSAADQYQMPQITETQRWRIWQQEVGRLATLPKYFWEQTATGDSTELLQLFSKGMGGTSKGSVIR